jgi:mono/diheme cytochrome c family protein
MGAFIMRFLRLLPLVMTLGVCPIGWAQSPTYGLGRTPSAEEIRAWDISISPTGKELPPGRGTAKEGAQFFMQKGCAGCHGATGTGGQAPPLVKGPPTAPGQAPHPPPAGVGGVHMVPDTGIMALRSPFATTIWDYINRGMPLNQEGTLKANEVYALTAFLLHKNDVIQEDEVMDAQSLPKVKMPNRDGFAPPPEWKHGTPRLQGYPKP